MPHTPGHNEEMLSGTARTPSSNTAQYKIYGTDEPYSGMTVEIGGYLYSTVGGTLEGQSMQLVPMGSNVNTDPNQNINNQILSNVNNPVTRTFTSRMVYYRQDGTPVPAGAKLHQHQDGTIMLGHDPNNMGAIVTRNQPVMQQVIPGDTLKPDISSTETETTRSYRAPRTPRTPRRTGGMGGY